MNHRAVIECLDKDAYVIGILVVPCRRRIAYGLSNGTAVCDVPAGPEGTVSRIVYLPACAGYNVFSLPQDDPEFGVTSTWIKNNDAIQNKEFSFPEHYLLASSMLDGERVVLDLTRGPGWQFPENIGKYVLVRTDYPGKLQTPPIP